MADEKPNEPEIEIVEDGTVVETTIEKKSDAEPDKIVSGEEGAEALKRKLDEERSRREAAEATARAEAERARTATAAVEDSEAREIQTAIDVAKRNKELAKKQYRDARAAGDIDAELEATEAIAQATSDLNSLEAGKAAREQIKKNPPPVTRQADPVDQLAAEIGQNWPKSGDWIRNNREVVRKNWGAVQSASNLAITSGKTADTPEYFAHVEKILRDNGVMGAAPAAANGNGHDPETVIVKTEEPLSQASRPVAPAAAPVSRSGGAPGQPRPGVVRLTRDEAEMAELSYPHLVKEKGKAAAHRAYVEAKMDLKANGKLN